MTQPLFRRLLGSTINDLSPVLRDAHDSRMDQRWRGVAQVETHPNPLARLLCLMMRLPAPGTAIPVTVQFERRGSAEHWHRDFAGRRYHSTLVERDGLMIERMGMATNIFRVSVEDGALRLDLIGFRFLGVPLPSTLRPHCHAREHGNDGCYVLDVPVDLWPFGRIIRYTGRMERIDD
ncbi:DUF4166 domain-containing protein [Sphingomonas sp. NCPPB 2930]|uniref:DUF4166 domain-containing protein n=1 Tax=Sphingomonas sp. NCPPB 2930 TaxID=3162788 RepID=UPI0036DBCA06